MAVDLNGLNPTATGYRPQIETRFRVLLTREAGIISGQLRPPQEACNPSLESSWEGELEYVIKSQRYAVYTEQFIEEVSGFQRLCTLIYWMKLGAFFTHTLRSSLGTDFLQVASLEELWFAPVTKLQRWFYGLQRAIEASGNWGFLVLEW